MRPILSFVAVLAVGFALGVEFHRAGLLQATAALVLPKPPPDLSDGPTYRYVAPLERDFPSSASVAMLGDSLTEVPIWGPGVANLGISSDTTDGALRRLDVVKAPTVFVMLGINDIRRGVPLADTLRNYRAIVDGLSGRKVYVESTLYTRRPEETARITALDDALVAICREKGCTFIDLNPQLSDGGLLRSEFSFDGTHLTPAGYAAWREAISPLLPSADPVPHSPAG